ncbi:hypothetical protein D3C76_897580 [compost metagenome]
MLLERLPSSSFWRMDVSPVKSRETIRLAMLFNLISGRVTIFEKKRESTRIKRIPPIPRYKKNQRNASFESFTSCNEVTVKSSSISPVLRFRGIIITELRLPLQGAIQFCFCIFRFLKSSICAGDKGNHSSSASNNMPWRGFHIFISGNTISVTVPDA